MNMTTESRVIPFPLPDSTSLLALTPAEADLAERGLIRTMTIVGNDFEHLGIYSGDRVIIKKKFGPSELTPKTLVVCDDPETGELGLIQECDPNRSGVLGIVIGLQETPNAQGTFKRAI